MRMQLDWKVIDEHHVALTLDLIAFSLFRAGAAPRGIEPYDMFVKALATLRGEFVPVPGKDQIRTIA
jgi:hypothetical protein